jgi:enamine deaminase RidA (YjgF/YER057c/UK114 family)
MVLEKMKKFHEQVRADFWKDHARAEYKPKWADVGEDACTCKGFRVEEETEEVF